MSRDRSKFAVFILSHGRADNVITLDTLKRSGYSGRTYFILDNEDETAEEYRARFGADNVIVFDRTGMVEQVDTADPEPGTRGVVYARNASFEIARDLGLDYFWQLDDDYTSFIYRYVGDGILDYTPIRNMDSVIDAMVELLEQSGAATVAMSQGGDHMGGIDGNIRAGALRKAMNSFIFRTDRPVEFLGRQNEDVNTYVVFGSRGDLFLTVTSLQLTQVRTQKSSGGMTELYLDTGTYVKSFYTVMMAPSCVSIRMMGQNHKRLHHSIRWDYAVPKIISSQYQKARKADG